MPSDASKITGKAAPVRRARLAGEAGRDFLVDLMAAESLEVLGEVFREGLSRVVPGDLHEILVFNTGRREKDLFLGTPGGFTDDERKDMLDFLEGKPEGHPVTEWHARGLGAGPVQVAGLVGLARWRRTEFYNRYNRRWRHDHEVDCLLTGNFEGGAAVISISRSSVAYTPREMGAVREIARPVGAALTRLLRLRSLAAWVSGRLLDHGVVRELFPMLTQREAEVLSWLAEGKSDSEIACIMEMRRMTTSTHVRNIISKLGVENRLCAAMAVARRCAGRAVPEAGINRA